MSPTQRTRAEFKRLGYTSEIVERWNQFAKKRQDLFNFIDLVLLADGSIIGVQVTSGTNHSARVRKIQGEPNAKQWLLCGGRIQIRSWTKKGPRGKPKKWTERVQEITLEDFS